MLPAGWSEYKDPSTGNPYFHNPATGETTWTRPEAPAGAMGVGAVPMGAAMFQPQQQMGMDINSMINQAAQAGAGTGGPQMGTVKSWNEEKGFGFIDPIGGGENVFVHRTALSDGNMLEKGASVSYELTFNAQKSKLQVSKCSGALGSPGVAPGQMPQAAPGAAAAPGGIPMFGFQAAPAQAPQANPGVQQSGTVKTWFDDKGFGFITPSDGTNDCYVHRTQLTDGQTLITGSTVNYMIEWNAAKNKYSAISVTGAIASAAGALAPGMMGGFGAAAPAMGQDRSSPYGLPGAMGVPGTMGF